MSTNTTPRAVYPILAIHAKALSFRYCCMGDFVARLRERDIASSQLTSQWSCTATGGCIRWGGVFLKATIHSTGIFIVQPNSFGNEIAPDPILLWVPTCVTCDL